MSSQIIPSFFARRERLGVALLASLFAFVLYAANTSSTVTYGGDCGELISASYRLGIAHPTGYPLYCLLGRTWASVLPLGEVGWRYNILSALCCALAVGLITASVHRLIAPPRKNASTHKAFPSFDSPAWAALGAGLLLAGFFDFWSQAVIAEVYPLSALMLCSLLYTAIAWHQSSEELEAASADWRWFYTLALLFGLTLNAHLACVFLVPGLFFYVLIQHRARFSRQWFPRLSAALAFVMAGWLLTLYLPLRASMFPAPRQLPASFTPLLQAKTANTSGPLDTADWWPLDWTHPVNARDWYAHISGKQYKSLLFKPFPVSVAGKEIQLPGFASTPQQVAGRLATLSERILLSYLWASPLLLIGLFFSFRRGPKENDESSEYSYSGGVWLGLLLLLPALANVGVQINYQVGDLANFFFPSYLVLAVWLGLGLHWLWQKAKTPFHRLLYVTLLICTIASQWWLMSSVSKRGDTSAREHALDRAKAVEELAAKTGQTPQVMLFGDDALWTFWYAKYVLGRAQQSHTPWRMRRTLEANDGYADHTAHWQKFGPVVLSGWDENTDKRFPYVMLNASGSMSLASNRILPEPAKTLNAALTAGEIQARFINQQTENGAAVIKRESMAAFEAHFRLPWSQMLSSQEAGAPTVDAKSRTTHVGYLEVFLSQSHPDSPGYFANAPAPDQADVRRTKDEGPPLLAWRQRRRVVVEQGTKQGAPLRLVVPLYFHGDSSPGSMQVWVRLVRSPGDKTTPWQKSVNFLLMG